MVGRHRKGEFPFTDRSQELARVLKRQRKEVLNISRKELASRAHVAESSIQAIEDGRTREPGLFTVISLAVALDLDLSEMMKSLRGGVPHKRLSGAKAPETPSMKAR